MTDNAQDQNAVKDNVTEKAALNETFEAFIEKQDEKVKGLYATHTSGLKSALQKERDEKKELSAQLKELLPKAEKGSDLEKQLTETVSKLDVAEKRASFVEDAIRPEIGCTNPKAAFLLAKADDLFDKSGKPDWAAIKAAAPELFRTNKGSTNGGDGSNNSHTTAPNMNDFIRASMGRK